jgi:hypothetical protein
MSGSGRRLPSLARKRSMVHCRFGTMSMDLSIAGSGRARRLPARPAIPSRGSVLHTRHAMLPNGEPWGHDQLHGEGREHRCRW